MCKQSFAGMIKFLEKPDILVLQNKGLLPYFQKFIKSDNGFA